jgi:hypothetical protein
MNYKSPNNKLHFIESEHAYLLAQFKSQMLRLRLSVLPTLQRLSLKMLSALRLKAWKTARTCRELHANSCS